MIRKSCFHSPVRPFLSKFSYLLLFIFRSNTLESGDGGAISLRRGSSATLFTGCSFWDNSAVNGGAIGGAFATAALHSSTILLNEAASNVSTVPRSRQSIKK